MGIRGGDSPAWWGDAAEAATAQGRGWGRVLPGAFDFAGFKPKGSGRLWGDIPVDAFTPQGLQGAPCLPWGFTRPLPPGLAPGAHHEEPQPPLPASGLQAARAYRGAEGPSLSG